MNVGIAMQLAGLLMLAITNAIWLRAYSKLELKASELDGQRTFLEADNARLQEELREQFKATNIADQQRDSLQQLIEDFHCDYQTRLCVWGIPEQETQEKKGHTK